MFSKCKNIYYKTREIFGHHKRDLVVYRVEEARDSLELAKEQFQTALERFSALTQFEGGELEERYKHLKIELERSQSKASSVHNHIDAVEDVAEALFDEWERELEVYQNRTLRSNSRQQLKATRQHYQRLIKAMARAEDKIKPVLGAFQDQVLFLKHNLNAQAIASLQNELITVGIDIAGLIKAMEKSISEANKFVTSLANQKALPAS